MFHGHISTDIIVGDIFWWYLLAIFVGDIFLNFLIYTYHWKKYVRAGTYNITSLIYISSIIKFSSARIVLCIKFLIQKFKGRSTHVHISYIIIVALHWVLGCTVCTDVALQLLELWNFKIWIEFSKADEWYWCPKKRNILKAKPPQALKIATVETSHVFWKVCSKIVKTTYILKNNNYISLYLFKYYYLTMGNNT